METTQVFIIIINHYIHGTVPPPWVSSVNATGPEVGKAGYCPHQARGLKSDLRIQNKNKINISTNIRQ
jgi:hypothetical protein